ncbi:MAG TPA: outer membrane beta-barrel domain-containing protein [Steroidobacteraceae bacterium]|nr:outer membrane beta-barrel domain-containing protein [Steroidobacteraceae bacterium]
MEIRLRILLLTVLLGLSGSLSGCATLHHLFGHDAPAAAAAADEGASTDRSADEDSTPPRVIQPEVERRNVKVPRIKSQDIELGGYIGTLNIEDFGAHRVFGVQAAYHVTEDFFLQAEAGRSKAGRTSFETLSNISLLTDNERWFKYYDMSVGYNFLPGEVFIGRNHAMTSSFYILAGVGATDFGGDSKFTANFGAGYKVLPTDWLAVHVAVEDRVFNSDLLGENKLASNLEAHLGLTVFF